jgi:hypothetical protein
VNKTVRNFVLAFALLTGITGAACAEVAVAGAARVGGTPGSVSAVHPHHPAADLVARTRP